MFTLGFILATLHAGRQKNSSLGEQDLTKTFNSHPFIKQLLLRGYYMLSTVRVTEDAAVSKMGKKMFLS